MNVFENEEGINLEYNYNGQSDSLSVLRDGDKINTIKEDKFLDNKGIIKNKGTVIKSLAIMQIKSQYLIGFV